MYSGSMLQKMYQQWCDGQSGSQHRWYAFVEMAARHNSTTPELMLEELKKYRWFKWGDQ